MTKPDRKSTASEKAPPRIGGAFFIALIALAVLAGLGFSVLRDQWGDRGMIPPPAPEGVYESDDGEGTSVRLHLMDEGRARLWQGYPDGPSFPGRYQREGDQIHLNMEGTNMVLVEHGDCLAPYDAPDQQLCPPR